MENFLEDGRLFFLWKIYRAYFGIVLFTNSENTTVYFRVAGVPTLEIQFITNESKDW